MEEMSGFPKVRPTGVRGAGEQSTAPALQGLQDESQWGRVAAHGGVLEDLRAAVRGVQQAQAEDLDIVDVDQLEKVLPQLLLDF
ncbi:centromere protein X isoform X3 [Alexandromys fortis]|uniref:centromere protein X isoform X3 n=1 Tax=Alexandromys fortis TaxID=100897 RepID=UPI00215200F2|nr:centromere protein X isoform X3 [Microtus fortis]